MIHTSYIATLPHEKFYSMEAYERRMDALRSGAFVPPPDDGYDPNADLRALQSSHKRKPAEQETYMSREQLQELRRVQAERIEVGVISTSSDETRTDGQEFG